MQVYTYARLSEDQLDQVRRFEAHTGKKALVFQQVKAQPEELTADELQALQALEERLGYVIIVVR